MNCIILILILIRGTYIPGPDTIFSLPYYLMKYNISVALELDLDYQFAIALETIVAEIFQVFE
jgi:hypothetical protein